MLNSSSLGGCVGGLGVTVIPTPPGPGGGGLGPLDDDAGNSILSPGGGILGTLLGGIGNVGLDILNGVG